MALAPDEAFSRRSVTAQVFGLAWPTLIEQLLGLAVGLVNTYLVGHIGASALAAVGLSTQIVNLLIGLFSAVGVGSTALVARLVGADDPQEAERIAGQSFLLAVAIGLLTLPPCVLWGGAMLALLGGTKDIVAPGGAYLAAVGFAMPLMALLFIGNATLRGAGDMRTPMWVMVLVNLVNVAVSWTLINGLGPFPELGVQGAGIGYGCGIAVGGICVVFALVSGRNSAGIRLRPATLRLQPKATWRLMRIGVPSGIEQTIMRLAQLATAVVVTQLGTPAYAGHQLGLQFLSVSFMPGFAFSVAATTLVGQELGRRAPKRAQACVHTTTWITCLVMSLMGLLAFFTAESLLRVFTNDVEVIDQGIDAVRMGALMQPPLGIYFVLAGALRGAGDTGFVLVAQAVPMWLIRIPLAFLLGPVLGFGLVGVWVAMILDTIGRSVLLWVRFRQGRWRYLRV